MLVDEQLWFVARHEIDYLSEVWPGDDLVVATWVRDFRRGLLTTREIRLATEGGEVWIAGPKTAVAVGQSVRVGETMTMKNFHSESLDRTFESIEFVSAIHVEGAASATGAGAEVAAAHGRARAAAPVSPWCSSRLSASCFSSVWSGLSEVIGSWKMKLMSLPRSAWSLPSGAPFSSSPR